MRKRDIVKLVFAILFTLTTLFFCFMTVLLNSSLPNGTEETESVGDAIGEGIAVVFIALLEVVSFGATIIPGVLGALVSALGWKCPTRGAKYVFRGLVILNLLLIVASALAVFL